MDQTDRIHLFLEVAREGSFAAAARCNGMTGPAVSKQIQNLEDRLGVKLFNRTTRHVALSEAGQIYYTKARQAMDDLKEAEQEIRDLKECPSGLLRLSAPLSFGKEYLADPLAQFAARYPEIEMAIDFDDRHVDLYRENYDLVIRIGSPKDSNLHMKKIAPCPLILCAAPSLLEKHQGLSSPEAITDFPTILYNKHGINPLWQFRHKQTGASHSFKITPVMQANSAEMMLAACKQAIGLALLPIFSAYPAIKAGSIVPVSLDGFEPVDRLEIYALYPEKRYQSTKVRLLLDHLAALGKAFPW